jgi:predicted DNA binding CopG/RHH family protein
MKLEIEMTKKQQVSASEDAWDAGELGRDEKHAVQYEGNIEAQVDESLGLQLISIRLQKSLIEDFKVIAQLNGMGYQTLMRQILTRFRDSELKRIARQAMSESGEVTAINRRRTA